MLVNTRHISKTLDASIYYYYRLRLRSEWALPFVARCRVIVFVSTSRYAHIAVYYKEEHNKHFISMRNHWINHILRLRSEWTLPFVASLLCCCVTGGPRNITVAPLYSQCNVLVDASSPWRQKLQHIAITRLTYNGLWRHGPGPPRYKEGRLYMVALMGDDSMYS